MTNHPNRSSRISIHQLSAADRDMLNRYSEVDTRSGEAFADADCTILVPDWREIAEAEIARHQ